MAENNKLTKEQLDNLKFTELVEYTKNHYNKKK
mgnify:CR=1 FL=1